jgi:hypothetical protein
MSPPKDRPVNPNPDYQDRDIRLRALVAALAVISLVALATVIGMAALLAHYKAEAEAAYEPVSPLASKRELPPEPRLQVVPAEELEAHRAMERLFLDHYQWIDRQAGLARIPIDRAMALVVERGLPVRERDHE